MNGPGGREHEEPEGPSDPVEPRSHRAVKESKKPELRPAKRWSGSDISLLLELPFLAATSWLAPTRAWSAYSGIRAALYAAHHREKARALAKRLELVDLADTVDAGGPALVRRHFATSFENKLQTLRSGAFGSWRPPIATEGFDRVREGLAAGNGVVLWVADFAYHRLVLKMAFHDEGHDVSHLSGPKHGWSSTLLGRRSFNRIPIAAEMRFLEERVVMSDLALPTEHRVVAAMRVLRRRLGDNRVVSISALTSDWGPERVGFFRGRIRLAGGPPSLSYASGAPVLPVFAVREPDRSFRVVVEAPLPIDRSLPRAAAVSGGVEAYVELLAGYVARYPSQWLGWRFLEPADADAAP